MRYFRDLSIIYLFITRDINKEACSRIFTLELFKKLEIIWISTIKSAHPIIYPLKSYYRIVKYMVKCLQYFAKETKLLDSIFIKI